MTELTARSRLPLAISAAVALVMILGAGAVALYGTRPGAGNSAAAAECRAAKPVAERLAPLARGEVAAFNAAGAPAPVPNLAFTGPDGAPKTLVDFRGRTVLLNLWATWCVPCRQEMPALDKLQADLGGDAFQVVAVNIDTRNLDRPKAWLREAGVQSLAYYADPQAKVFQDLKRVGKAVGLPTTLLIDPRGCELGVLAGPAAWDSADALKLVRAAVERSAAETPFNTPKE
jgi:thiol-disulfide isomerase/thioredoxin